MTFKEFKKGIKAIPFSTWKKILVPAVLILIPTIIALSLFNITFIDFMGGIVAIGIFLGSYALVYKFIAKFAGW